MAAFLGGVLSDQFFGQDCSARKINGVNAEEFLLLG